MKPSDFSGELLGCPFCGGMAEEHWPNSTTQHFVQCEVCGARTSTSLASHGGSAKDEWNRRAQSVQEMNELASVSETAKSDTQAGLPIVDEAPPAQEAPKSMHVEGGVHREVVLTNEMVERACQSLYGDRNFAGRGWTLDAGDDADFARGLVRAALKAALHPSPGTGKNQDQEGTWSDDGKEWTPEAVRKFNIGDRVTKAKGSSWTGHVVGFYRTSLTPIGYAIESENEPGLVQIYPESALDRPK